MATTANLISGELSHSFEWASAMSIGEGIEYDARTDRLVVGSMLDGSVYAVPAHSEADVSDGPVAFSSYESTLAYQIYDGISEILAEPFAGLQSVGIKVHEGYAYVAQNNFPPTLKSALLRVSLDDPSDFAHVDLSAVSNPDVSFNSIVGEVEPYTIMANDVVVDPDTGLAYVTDTVGGQILEVDFSDATAEPRIVLRDGGVGGHNGIEITTDGDLILAVTRFDDSEPGLYRVDSTSGEAEAVVVSPFYPTGLDGIEFNEDRSVLFLTRGEGSNSITALRSDDGWSSAYIVAGYDSGCPLSTPTTSAINHATGDLFTWCAQEFSQAPFYISRLPGIAHTTNADAVIDIGAVGRVGEGVAYDPVTDRVLVSHLFGGQGLVAVDNTRAASVELAEGDSVAVGTQDYLTFGIHVAGDDGCTLLAASMVFPFDSTTASGVAEVDICTGETRKYVDFKTNPYIVDQENPVSAANDLAVIPASGEVFVTDFARGSILRVAADLESYAAPLYLQGDTNPFTQPDGTSIGLGGVVGPNGIAPFGEHELLVGTIDFSGGTQGSLVRVDVNSGEWNTVELDSTISPSFGVDGLLLDSSGKIAFMVDFLSGEVMAFVSEDGWRSATYALSFHTGAECLPTTNTWAGDDLVVLCAKGFTGEGSQGLVRFNDAVAKVSASIAAADTTDGTGYEVACGGASFGYCTEGEECLVMACSMTGECGATVQYECAAPELYFNQAVAKIESHVVEAVREATVLEPTESDGESQNDAEESSVSTESWLAAAGAGIGAFVAVAAIATVVSRRRENGQQSPAIRRMSHPLVVEVENPVVNEV